MATANFIKIAVKSGTTTDESAEKSLANYNAWETVSQEWATNPDDSQAWEWADIDDLQIGVSLVRTHAGNYVKCTQVYVVVDYIIPIIIGTVATATRTGGVIRPASVIVGNLVSALRSWGRAETASVIIGIVVSASKITGFVKSASVIIGNLVTASRAMTFTRGASVIVGNLVTASKSWGTARAAAVIVGIIASASRVWGVVKTATVIIGVKLIVEFTISRILRILVNIFAHPLKITSTLASPLTIKSTISRG